MEKEEYLEQIPVIEQKTEEIVGGSGNNRFKKPEEEKTARIPNKDKKNTTLYGGRLKQSQQPL